MITKDEDRPSPFELWQQAGGDGEEYRRLLREHGHLIPREPGDDSPLLPCGWESGSKATGGFVDPKRVYIVGETGPEQDIPALPVLPTGPNEEHP